MGKLLALITDRIRSIGECYVFTGVCHSVHNWGVYTPLNTPPPPDAPLDTHTHTDTYPLHPPGHTHTLDNPPVRSTGGRYASYWNAFLLNLNVRYFLVSLECVNKMFFVILYFQKRHGSRI